MFAPLIHHNADISPKPAGVSARALPREPEAEAVPDVVWAGVVTVFGHAACV